MASPLSNPWVSGPLGAGIVVYLVVSFTPERIKQPVRDFFTGEMRREGGKEPELVTGREKLFRAIPKAGPDKIEPLLGRSGAGTSRDLFREVPKGVQEKPKEAGAVPDVPEGSGLLAVWIDGDKRVALMTDGMVREGEGWGIFTVEKITPDSVRLRHEAGQRVLVLGEIKVKAVGGGAGPGAKTASVKPAEGAAEGQVQKVLDMQKSMDPSKLLQGFPQRMMDSLMGNPQKAVETK
jgi:hypothetical protein